MAHEQQSEVNCSLYWLVSATCLGLENSCFDVWELAIRDMMASNGVKSEKLNLRLPFGADEHLCLSSLFSVYGGGESRLFFQFCLGSDFKLLRTGSCASFLP